MSRSGSPSAAAGTSPLALRAFHAVVFLGVGSATVAGMVTELRQLGEGLFHPWHFGTPPSAAGTAAAFVALGLCLALLVFLFLGRSAPLWMSAVLLVCLVVAMLNQDYKVSHRSAPGANLSMLEAGQALHEKMRAQLQRTQAVPNTREQWSAALAAVVTENENLSSPYRQRFFKPTAWRVEMLGTEGDFLADAPPGTFAIWIPDDASRFTITLFGLDPEHQVVRLRDDRGQVIELKGAFNPDTLQ